MILSLVSYDSRIFVKEGFSLRTIANHRTVGEESNREKKLDFVDWENVDDKVAYFFFACAVVRRLRSPEIFDS